ncbi:MAG: L-threonylcarbamoyladenylate synthase [Candidatus Paceibacterota bacterium]|jgi:L-threonylcarbamoyladenylate synthase
MERYVNIIKDGGIGVIPTDTIYGIVASAFSIEGVEKVYKIKGRDSKKPPVILISSVKDLNLFGARLTEKAKIFMKKFWPGRISVALSVDKVGLDHLDRLDGTLAFRLPDKKDLIEFLKKTGPIIAPSANPEGMPPARNIEEARKYFGLPGQGDKVDFYVDEGEISGLSSTLVKIVDNEVSILREGAIKSDDIIKVWKEI